MRDKYLRYVFFAFTLLLVLTFVISTAAHAEEMTSTSSETSVSEPLEPSASESENTVDDSSSSSMEEPESSSSMESEASSGDESDSSSSSEEETSSSSSMMESGISSQPPQPPGLSSSIPESFPENTGTMDEETKKNISSIRENFDILLYFVIPFSVAILALYKFFSWFYSTFIDRAL